MLQRMRGLPWGAKTMKVLHLVAGELSGGAARGAYWLHRAQLGLGIDSTLITSGRDNLGDTSVVALRSTRTKRALAVFGAELGRLPIRLYPRREDRIFNTGIDGLSFMKHPAYRNADVVHMHWINGLVAMRTLRQVKKPVVWTMRDMWPLTGGCHYAMTCDRYRVGCGQCPQLNSGMVMDLSRFVVSNKVASMPPKLQIIGISHWLSNCARESRVFSGYPVETISNNVDTQQFHPIDTHVAREVLGLRKDRRIILVGAHRVGDFYKGFDLFVEAMHTLDTRDVHLVLFGTVSDRDLQGLRVEYSNLGFLSDTVSLRLAYAAADVFVAPSRMEAFGKTLAEAMACGTPVVCFDATGTSDVVEHEVTGFKATPFDPVDLARGVRWVLSRNEAELQMLRKGARKRAVTLFDSRVIATQYKDLYERMLRVA